MSEQSPSIPTPAAPDRRRLRRNLMLGGPTVIVLVSGVLYMFSGRYIGTENAYVKADKVAVSAQVSGEIAQVAVHENQPVAKGEVLFGLDPRPFQIALDKAAAELRGVRAEVAGLQAGYADKEKELALTQQDRDFAKREYERQLGLAKRQVASQTRLDEAQHAYVAAEQRVVATRQALTHLRAQLGGDPTLALDAQPRVQQAQAARDQAALDLEHATVRAPFAGVASNAPEPGQYVQAGRPVLSLVSDHHVWVEANFKETDLTHVRPGQPVEIDVDTYPGHAWHGKVASISQATGAEFSVLPAQNTTGNWVKVVQRIPVRISIEGEDNAPILRAGMSTQVEIDTGYHHMPRIFGAALPTTASGTH